MDTQSLKVLLVLISFLAISSTTKVSENEKITQIFSEIRQIDNETVQNLFYSPLVNSVDVNCMVDQYEKYNLTESLIEKISFNSENSEEIFKTLIFFDIAAICSAKLDPILDFNFDNFLTFKILIDAFIDDRELKTYKDALICVNNLTITQGLWDNQLHPLSLTSQLTNETEEKCNEYFGVWLITDMAVESAVVQMFNRSCSLSILKEVETLALKTAMLLQVNLTELQKTQERKNFTENIHKILESILTCASQPPEKVESPLEGFIELTVQSIVGGLFNKVSDDPQNSVEKIINQ